MTDFDDIGLLIAADLQRSGASGADVRPTFNRLVERAVDRHGGPVAERTKQIREAARPHVEAAGYRW